MLQRYCLLLLGSLLLCGTAFAQGQPRLIVNEFLTDPPNDLAGDANGDGIRDSAEDEFLELANVSGAPIDLTGWMAGDDEAVNFTFPDGYILPPRGILVIFGGGDVTGVPGYDPDPLQTRVFSADSTVGNGFANGGDYIVIKSPDGTEDMYVAYKSKVGLGAPATSATEGIEFDFGVDVAALTDDVSVTRFPDGNVDVPDPFVQHSSITAALFSPGTTIDGKSELPKAVPPIHLIINEVLADPPGGLAGDANGDGIRDASQDEFVEIANAGNDPVDMTGYRLGDDEGIGFTFPDGYILPPRALLVVFGGGDVTGVPGYDADPLQTRVFSADSTVGNGLANGGEVIMLLSPDGSYDMWLAYGSKSGTGGPGEGTFPEGTTFEFEIDVSAAANADNSITRFPDGNVNLLDTFVQHLSVSTNAFSPGTTIDGRTTLPVPQPPITVVINEVLADNGGLDVNGDGTADALADQFIEIANTSDEDGVDLSGWQVGDGSGLSFTFPNGYVLAPQAIAAVFGGGDVSAMPGYDADPLKTRVFAAGGSLGGGLDPAGDFAVLVSDDGAYDAYVVFGSAVGTGDPVVEGAEGTEWEFVLATEAAADNDNSITRDPDGEFLNPDPFVQHLLVSDQPWSPAQTSDGLPSLDAFINVPHPWGTGHALHFNWWEHDRVEVREASQLMPTRMDQGTVELWFKPDSTITFDSHPPDFTYLIGKNFGGNHPGDLGLAWDRGEGRLLFFMQDGQSTTNLTQSARIDEVFHPRWYHVAVTWNTAGNMRMFIDGKLVSETPSAVPLLGGEQMIIIGSGATELLNDRFETFRGMIDEVRFSLVERYTTDFELPTAPYEPDQFTLALWHFDEGGGDVAADASGFGFTGYLGGNDNDGNPSPATQPSWVDIAALVGVEEEPGELPARFALEQNYPNPFNPTTEIRFQVPRAADVRLEVYNVLGQRVATLVDRQMTVGTYTATFDATSFASGVYFYVLRAEDSNLVRKMVLLK